MVEAKEAKGFEPGVEENQSTPTQPFRMVGNKPGISNVSTLALVAGIKPRASSSVDYYEILGVDRMASADVRSLTGSLARPDAVAVHAHSLVRSFSR